MEHIIELDDEVLNKFGDDVIFEMITILKRAGKSNTGSLINSFKYQFKETAQGITMDLYANDYAYYVDKGRKPGSYAPVSAIKKWCRSKGIKESIAFPINRKIYKFGIKPTPFILQGFNNALKKDLIIITSKFKQNIIQILKEE